MCLTLGERVEPSHIQKSYIDMKRTWVQRVTGLTLAG